MKAFLIAMCMLLPIFLSAQEQWEPLPEPPMTFKEGFPLRPDDANRHALAAPRDNKQVEARFKTRELSLFGIAAIAAAIAFVVLGIKLRKPRSQAATEAEKAEKLRYQIMGELKLLRNTLSKTTPDAFYCRITDLMRLYLENICHLEADTKTTDEFFQDLAVNTALDPKLRDELHTFLDKADKVKFANEAADSRMEDEALAFAEKFISRRF